TAAGLVSRELSPASARQTSDECLERIAPHVSAGSTPTFLSRESPPWRDGRSLQTTPVNSPPLSISLQTDASNPNGARVPMSHNPHSNSHTSYMDQESCDPGWLCGVKKVFPADLGRSVLSSVPFSDLSHVLSNRCGQNFRIPLIP